ncbi:uncharacterized protein PV09_09554 [Verruconis gallopava]|uniref:Kinesin light chain n=1 Tax=Verruconis gallopava TaxID=253628 RepID=A0A0D2AIC9_9PEZI|nr:uncharacterized protein PV09_09554 [Verruconis gallopava]KIV98673.1 hypothetical protein PV09_09554 [Verruconis gallopava]
MAQLADTYRDPGRWKETEELQVSRVLKEAEELQVQVKDIWLRMLGEEHPNTLISMDNLGSMYSYQGRWRGA